MTKTARIVFDTDLSTEELIDKLESTDVLSTLANDFGVHPLVTVKPRGEES